MKTVSKKLLSLLLVAILLVSALPFQAFAAPHDNLHVLSTEWVNSASAHWKKCTDPNCDGGTAAQYELANHTFDQTTYVCNVCNYPCDHAYDSHGENTKVAVPPTCCQPGKNGVYCGGCGKWLRDGDVIPATGVHEYVAGKCMKVRHTGDHLPYVWGNDATNHWQICNYSNCEFEGSVVPSTKNAHTWENGACKVCGRTCSPHSEVEAPGTYEAPTCVKPGKKADIICNVCKMPIRKGETIPATGDHNFENGICTECGTVQEGASLSIWLDPNGGTIDGLLTGAASVKQGAPISTLPTPTRQGYTFAGWYVGDTLISNGQIYTSDKASFAVARWTEITYQLTIRRVLNGNNATAKTIHTVNVPAGTPLLGYLSENVASIVRSELALTPGYTWEYSYWRDYSGTQPLTSQADCMNQAQTVFVNFVSKSYNLYFNANGGTVTPLSKKVYFGSPVGTLPTASMSGKVFQGWQDVNGNLYNANTVYQVAGDTSLTAVWKDEALVILYIYINGDFSSCNRMIVMDQYVKNSNISRADVYAQVAKYYTPASGTLSIAGLFDEYAWSSYRANTGKAGTENIEINDSHPNKIYVMVNNANTGSTIITGNTTIPTIPANGATTPAGAYWVNLGNGNGYWVYPAPSTPNSTYPTYVIIGSNPKTGDTAKIEIAAAVMVLAAAALITVMALRKKKSV